MSRNYQAFILALTLFLAPVVTEPAAAAGTQRFPEVVSAQVQARSGNRFDFDVTISSPYDSPQRYADAFRVLNAEGVSLGERILLHDHAGEQPFTRDLYGVTIPAGIRTVVIQARDLKYGYGGKTIRVALPGR